MAEEYGVRIAGLRTTIRSLRRLGVEASDLKAAFHAAGELVANTAADLVHSKSGRLAASIRASNSTNKAVVRAGSAAVPYAAANNYGWGSLHANYKHGRKATQRLRGSYEGAHWLETAVMLDEGNVARIIDDELSAIIRTLDL